MLAKLSLLIVFVINATIIQSFGASYSIFLLCKEIKCLRIPKARDKKHTKNIDKNKKEDNISTKFNVIQLNLTAFMQRINFNRRT